ncbi:hypothetical protein BST61_g5913 [Cercospora zeina]
MSPLPHAAELLDYTNGDASDPQQVTGQTLFWALVPLALNVMGQGSPSAKMIFDSGYLGEGSMVPHLSSPIFVVADCILDIVAIFQAFCSTPAEATSAEAISAEATSEEEVSNADSSKSQLTVGNISVRLLLVLFGVLPQAIRLFAMKGIPVVQALAVVFLAGSIARMVAIFAFRYKPDSHRKAHEWILSMPAGKEIVRDVLLLCHAVICCIIWYRIAQVPYLDLSDAMENIKNLCSWISVILTLLTAAMCCYWVLGMFFAPLWWFCRLPVSPLPVWFFFTMWLALPRRLLEAGETRVACLQDLGSTICANANTCRNVMDCCMRRIENTFPLIVTALVSSYVLAIVLVKGSAFFPGDIAASTGDPIIEEAATDVPDVEAATGVPDVEAAPSSSRSTEDSILGKSADLQGLLTVYFALCTPIKDTSKRSEIYQRWLLTAISFWLFRQLVPRALASAWVGRDNDEMPNKAENDINEENTDKETLPKEVNDSKGAGAMPNEVTYDEDSKEHCDSPQISPAYRCLRVLRIVCLLTVLGFIQLVVFLFLALLTLWDLGPFYRKYQTMGRKIGPTTHWVAFALLNLATAAMYFFVAFEGSGTENPAWTNILNR